MALPAPAACSAFSLIEMLIVVALLVVFHVLYFTSISGRKQRGMKTVCAENLQRIYVAANIYATEHGGRFPVVQSASHSADALRVLIPKYTSETGAFVCPGTGKPSDVPPDEFGRRKIGYSYYMGLSASNTLLPLLTDAQVNTKSKETGQKVFSASGKPPGNNHKQFGGNLLFCDGHVQSISTNATFPMVLTPGVTLLNP
jgi:prepilin-type N-terminal cleavage/methylation domain-containing protein/prepilin-type processing-associated H-X9-DG protein